MSNRNLTLQKIQERKRWLLPAWMLLLVSLACQLSLGGPEAPTDRTPAAPPAQSQDWRSIIANARPGDTLDVTLTEADLTAIVARQVVSLSDITISEPRVILRNGQMEVYGKADASGISGNFQAVLNVKVENGRAGLEVVSANFGSLPVPSSLTERMTAALDDALSDATGAGQSRLYVNRVELFDGYMTINATVQ